MQSVVSFTIHKFVRGIGSITSTDEGQWRKLLWAYSPRSVREVTFAPLPHSGNTMTRCTVTFDGDVDISAAQRMAKKTGLMYVEFSDFHTEVPATASA